MSAPEDGGRFSLYRLCECPECEGRGKADHWPMGAHGERVKVKCPDCRGEGRIRQELAACDTPEAVGVALVTLAREGEWTDENGDPCAFGCLDRLPECEHCEGQGCDRCSGTGIKSTGTWLIRPWLPSPRNVSDAGRVLNTAKRR